jgi:uncharacterized protein involved in type VI secretion and phage assembly
MNLMGALIAAGERPGSGRLYGLVVGIVTNNQDPDNLGRVKVRFPWLSDTEESQWARVAAPMAGNQRGVYFLPEVDDEVLVAFEQGDPRFPYVLGALWNGKDAPPATNSDGKNNVRIIQSRSGHVVKLNDEDGKETIEIIDKSGNNSIVIDTAHNTLRIIADKDIELTAKETIKLTAKNVEISSSETTKIEAKQGMDVKASGELNVKGSKVNIN